MELDLIDKKLLYELDANSRQSKTQLAKKLKISIQLVSFRLNKLNKENVLTSYYTVIDTSKLGLTIHKCFIKLQNINSIEDENKFINYLKNHPNIVWVTSCEGNFDLAFGVWAKDIVDLDITLKEINKKFGNYINQKEISSIIKGQYFIRNYLVSKEMQTSMKESFFGAVPSSNSIDKKDWKILHMLGENSRVKISEIANRIELSMDSTSKRIKKLQNSKIIQHYNIVPNEDVYPYLHYKIFLKTKNFSEKDEDRIYLFSKLQENIVYLVKSVGSWDFEIDVEVENVKQLRDIMMQFKLKFQEVLHDYSTLQILKVYKYNFCPSIKK
ncbi:MAG: Lrp/AsnC family transcriptional regulator [Nanoarchaeales archaeon]|nr:Lrp/AsnC family transcriptional regulator [Nanoarchaeales archaeon]